MGVLTDPVAMEAGSLPDRAARAVRALRQPDPSLKTVPNTIRQSLAEIIEQLLEKSFPEPGRDPHGR